MILDSVRLSIATLVCLTALGDAVRAHDAPADVAAHLFVKPEGDRVKLLVRVPLKAIRDLDFPAQPNGYLDVERLAPLLADAANVWLGNFIDLYAAGTQLPRARLLRTQISIESDRSFAGFGEAWRRLHEAPPANTANLSWEQVFLDVAYEYARTSKGALSIHARLSHLANRVTTVVRYVPDGGQERAYQLDGDAGVVPLDPRWHQAAARFVYLGFVHILDGTDHLLFLLCLVLPLRQFRPLILVVTAFTIAHSITLIASALEAIPTALWFPPLIETLIAGSIVYMALENIIGNANLHRRWLIAFAFGLVHGFGFSFALEQTLQFAGSHLLISLVSFNLGVELGQILVLLLLAPLSQLLFRYVVAERTGIIVVSAFVAHTGWHWMVERWQQFRQFPIAWTTIDAVAVLNGLLPIAVAVFALWLVWVGRQWIATTFNGVISTGPNRPDRGSGENP
ncbi:MAG: HupE/UreJ family protein [Bryobacterales bacterium]|nr:HupE/UreJ family protein [Bryobacterales bacterium]